MENLKSNTKTIRNDKVYTDSQLKFFSLAYADDDTTIHDEEINDVFRNKPEEFREKMIEAFNKYDEIYLSSITLSVADLGALTAKRLSVCLEAEDDIFNQYYSIYDEHKNINHFTFYLTSNLGIADMLFYDFVDRAAELIKKVMSEITVCAYNEKTKKYKMTPIFKCANRNMTISNTNINIVEPGNVVSDENQLKFFSSFFVEHL